jgi:hypothetical protein
MSFLARRTEPTQGSHLIGTYRPVDVIVHQHRIKVLAQELQRTAPPSLLLPFLSSAAIRGLPAPAFDGGTELPIDDLVDVLQSYRREPALHGSGAGLRGGGGILAFHGDQWQLTSTAAG